MTPSWEQVVALPWQDQAPRFAHALTELLKQAQQKGSDFFVAQCGYQLAACTDMYAMWGYFCQQAGSQLSASQKSQVAAPSTFLGWLQQAKQAHARCCAVLPVQWTVGLKRMQKTALILKPSLQQQQKEGDCWQPSTLDLVLSVMKESRSQGPTNICSGCGGAQAHLKVCGGCKQAQYCR